MPGQSVDLAGLEMVRGRLGERGLRLEAKRRAREASGPGMPCAALAIRALLYGKPVLGGPKTLPCSLGPSRQFPFFPRRVN